MADITPTDIENLHFRRSMSGYAREEVDDFLQQVSDSLFHALEENQRLRTQVDDLRGQLQRYQQTEDLIRNALVLAERTADETRQRAHEEADLIRRQAEENIRALRAEQDTLQQQRLRVIAELRGVLQSQLALLETQERRLTTPPGGGG